MGVVCSDTRSFQMARQEGTNALGNLAEARAARLTTLGDIPLVVLSRRWSEGSPRPGESATDAEQLEAVHHELQVKLAALSSRGKLVVAESGHYIQVGQPELVVDAIREVVEAERELG
jgi:hypothetical protein